MKRVYVYNNHVQRAKNPGACTNRPMIYSTFQCDGYCLHEVPASTRRAEHKAALAEHNEKCSEFDRTCWRCNGFIHPMDRGK